MIGDLIEKSSHRTIETEALKMKNVETGSEKYESGDYSDKTYQKLQK